MPISRPRIICLMTSSIDGRLHPSRWTESPDGTTRDWSASYETIHGEVGGDGWIVGRTTMAEMANGDPHPPADPRTPARSCHFATRTGPFAIALDRSGKLHFAKPDIGGDSVIVLLGHDVPDAHLAELAEDGISYVVAQDEEMALAPLLVALVAKLGVSTLLLEGGGHVNGSFFAAGLVDELRVILAPALDGAPNPAIVEAGSNGLEGKIRLSLLACDRLDHGAVVLRDAVTTVTPVG